MLLMNRMPLSEMLAKDDNGRKDCLNIPPRKTGKMRRRSEAGDQLSKGDEEDAGVSQLQMAT